MKNINTFNSTHDIYGNRRNLVVNHDTKELYFYGGHVFDLGIVTDNMGIRLVNRMHKNYLAEGYKPVSDARVREWRNPFAE